MELQPPVARFQQIASYYADEIAAGTYAPGSRLPSESEMIAKWGVSKNTVRYALQELRNRGLVERQQGRGTFVLAGSAPAATITRQITRTGRRHQEHGYTQVGEPRVERIVIDGVSASFLGRDPNDEDEALRVTRVLVDDAGHRALHSLIIPMDLATTAPNVINTPTMPVTELYTELREAGYEDLEWTEYVTARPALPDEQVAMTLGDTGPTVLITYRVTHHDERPLIAEQLRCSAARTSLAFPLTATRTKAKRPRKAEGTAE